MLKYSKKRQQYENSTKTNVVKILKGAWSYGHWKYLDFIDNKVIFNAYSYSTTTSKHQSETYSLLLNLGFKPSLIIGTRASLNCPRDIVKEYENKIKELKCEISKPRTHKKKNRERLSLIKNYEYIIKRINKIYRLGNPMQHLANETIGHEVFK